MENKFSQRLFDNFTNILELLLDPIPTEKYLIEYFQKCAIFIKGNESKDFDNILSITKVSEFFEMHSMNFSDDIRLNRYDLQKLKQEEYQQKGRAYSDIVWRAYSDGYSIQWLNSQTYSTYVEKLLTRLQDSFGFHANAYIYVTPPGCQGFAPRWDDYDSFVLQLQGEHLWRVYKPLHKDHELPFQSSGSLSKEYIDLLEPCIHVSLEAGDLIYIPRGFMHQAETPSKSRSLHITICFNQQSTWGDFLKILLPKAVDHAMQTDIKFRESLPIGYLNHFGLIHDKSQLSEKSRTEFHVNCERLVKKLINEYIPLEVDNSVDNMAQKFMQNTLPPILTEEEKLKTIHGQGVRWDNDCGCVIGLIKFELETRIRLLRRHCLRVIQQNIVDFHLLVFYSIENARDRNESCWTFEVDEETKSSFEMLVSSYPEYISIQQLPLATKESKIDFVKTLYDKLLICTESTLQCSSSLR